MRLVVGLGNPGKEYENTRHNIGFSIIDNYCRNNIFKKKYNGLYTKLKINGEIVVFLKPLSYMNLSGIVVKKYVNYYKIPLCNVFIVYDDMDFDIGTYKLKHTGSAGGHNGMKSVLECLGTQNIQRLRIGISKSICDKAKYVTSDFTNEEMIIIKKMLNKSIDIINDYFILSFDSLMNRYNKNE